jgi:hypothetical protein
MQTVSKSPPFEKGDLGGFLMDMKFPLAPLNKGGNLSP